MNNPLTPEYLAELEAALNGSDINPQRQVVLDRAARTFHAIAPLLMDRKIYRPPFDCYNEKNAAECRGYNRAIDNFTSKIEKVLRDG